MNKRDENIICVSDAEMRRQGCGPPPTVVKHRDDKIICVSDAEMRRQGRGPPPTVEKIKKKYRRRGRRISGRKGCRRSRRRRFVPIGLDDMATAKAGDDDDGDECNDDEEKEDGGDRRSRRPRLLDVVDGASLGTALDDTEGDELGVVDGVALGDTDGVTDCVVLGVADGVLVGSIDGNTDGDAEGTTLGDDEGDIVGDSEGAALGDTEGDILGELDGDDDGTDDGDTDGLIDGLIDGDHLGLVLGDIKGAALGTTDRAAEGDAIGTDHGDRLGELDVTVDGETLEDTEGAMLGATLGDTERDALGTAEVVIDGVLLGEVDVTKDAMVDKFVPTTNFEKELHAALQKAGQKDEQSMLGAEQQLQLMKNAKKVLKDIVNDEPIEEKLLLKFSFMQKGIEKQKKLAQEEAKQLLRELEEIEYPKKRKRVRKNDTINDINTPQRTTETSAENGEINPWLVSASSIAKDNSNKNSVAKGSVSLKKPKMVSVDIEGARNILNDDVGKTKNSHHNEGKEGNNDERMISQLSQDELVRKVSAAPSDTQIEEEFAMEKDKVAHEIDDTKTSLQKKEEKQMEAVSGCGSLAEDGAPEPTKKSVKEGDALGITLGVEEGDTILDGDATVVLVS